MTADLHVVDSAEAEKQAILAVEQALRGSTAVAPLADRQMMQDAALADAMEVVARRRDRRRRQRSFVLMIYYAHILTAFVIGLLLSNLIWMIGTGIRNEIIAETFGVLMMMSIVFILLWHQRNQQGA